MTRQPAPLFDPNHEDTAAHAAELQATDALLDDAGSGRRHRRVDPIAEQLALLRAMADEAPQPELVDLDTAQAAIAAGVRAHRGRKRVWWLRWVAALVLFGLAVALIVVLSGHVGVGITPHSF